MAKLVIDWLSRRKGAAVFVKGVATPSWEGGAKCPEIP